MQHVCDTLTMYLVFVVSCNAENQSVEMSSKSISPSSSITILEITFIWVQPRPRTLGGMLDSISLSVLDV